MRLLAVLSLTLWLMPQAWPSPAVPLRIVVISDLNGSYGSTRYHQRIPSAIERIMELQPDLVISTGDMVAGQRRPHLSRSEIEAMWRLFHREVSGPLSAAGIPLAVTPGNHDGSAYDGFRLERETYAEQSRALEARLNLVDGAHYPFHYAFSVGDALFISLDATRPGPLPDAQKNWLRDLLKESASSFEHRVIFSHLPQWPFAQGREREILADRELDTILQQAGVDLYLSGHHHAFYPGIKDGIRYVSQACLGGGPRKLLGNNRLSKHSFTVVDISANGATTIRAYQAPDFTRVIDWHTLPARIHSRHAKLIRADLANVEYLGMSSLTLTPPRRLTERGLQRGPEANTISR